MTKNLGQNEGGDPSGDRDGEAAELVGQVEDAVHRGRRRRDPTGRQHR